jgi:hypothetical protein
MRAGLGITVVVVIDVVGTVDVTTDVVGTVVVTTDVVGTVVDVVTVCVITGGFITTYAAAPIAINATAPRPA